MCVTLSSRGVRLSAPAPARGEETFPGGSRFSPRTAALWLYHIDAAELPADENLELLADLAAGVQPLSMEAELAEIENLERLADIYEEQLPVSAEAGLVRETAENVREALDSDSFDFLNFLIGLHEELGVEIGGADYGQLTTLADMIRYLAARV